eukprot:PhM_4_TR5305/c0_g1_i2/m.25091
MTDHPRFPADVLTRVPVTPPMMMQSTNHNDTESAEMVGGAHSTSDSSQKQAIFAPEEEALHRTASGSGQMGSSSSINNLHGGGGIGGHNKPRTSCVAAVMLQTVLIGVVAVVCIAAVVSQSPMNWLKLTEHRFDQAHDAWCSSDAKTAMRALPETLEMKGDASSISVAGQGRAMLLSSVKLRRIERHLSTTVAELLHIHSNSGSGSSSSGNSYDASSTEHYVFVQYAFAGAVTVYLSGGEQQQHVVDLYVLMGTSQLKVFSGTIQDTRNASLCLTSLVLNVYPKSSTTWAMAGSNAEYLTPCNDSSDSSSNNMSNKLQLPIFIELRHIADPINTLSLNPTSAIFDADTKSITGLVMVTFVTIAMLTVSVFVTITQLRRSVLCESTTAAAAARRRQYEMVSLDRF